MKQNKFLKSTALVVLSVIIIIGCSLILKGKLLLQDKPHTLTGDDRKILLAEGIALLHNPILSLFVLEQKRIDNTLIYRICIDGYEYVMVDNGTSHIVQSFSSKFLGTNGVLGPKKCNRKN